MKDAKVTVFFLCLFAWLDFVQAQPSDFPMSPIFNFPPELYKASTLGAVSPAFFSRVGILKFKIRSFTSTSEMADSRTVITTHFDSMGRPSEQTEEKYFLERDSSWSFLFRNTYDFFVDGRMVLCDGCIHPEYDGQIDEHGRIIYDGMERMYSYDSLGRVVSNARIPQSEKMEVWKDTVTAQWSEEGVLAGVYEVRVFNGYSGDHSVRSWLHYNYTNDVLSSVESRLEENYPDGRTFITLKIMQYIWKGVYLSNATELHEDAEGNSEIYGTFDYFYNKRGLPEKVIINYEGQENTPGWVVAFSYEFY